MGLLRSWGALFLGLVVLAAADVALAGSTQFEWNSPATGNWTDPAKWSPNGVPGVEESDEVYIGRGAGSGGTVILDSAVSSINRFNIGGGGTGTLDVRAGASLATINTGSADSMGINGHGTLLVSGGTLTLGRRLVVDSGTIDISGGILDMPDTTIGNLSLAIDGVANLTVRGTGRLNVGNDLKIGDGGEGHFIQSGGRTDVVRDLVIGGPVSIGEATISGGQLNVGGRLLVGGPGGTGTLNLQTSAPEIVAGAFEVAANSGLQLDLAATLSPIRATTANLAGELSVAMSVNPPVGAIYPLLRVGGTAAHVATFLDKPQGTIFLADAAGDDLPLRISYQANLDGGSTANDVTLTVLRRGDATLDGTVNRADVARLVANWNASGGFAQGDLDGNGVVGLSDLMTLHRNLSASPALATAVPEPATLLSSLAAIALLAIFWRLDLIRRRV